jgi:hypothetical protein
MKLAGALISGLFLAIPAAPTVSAADYTVVVHPSVPGKQIRKQDLAAIFLGHAKEWANGTPTAPVDQSAKSDVRAKFSSTGRKRSSMACVPHPYGARTQRCSRSSRPRKAPSATSRPTPRSHLA